MSSNDLPSTSNTDGNRSMRGLKDSAGEDICCIYRVPRLLAQDNETTFHPKVVSIGPYHHGEKHLQMVQEHKLRLFEIFIREAQKKGVDKKNLVDAVSNLEEHIRASYSESLGDESLGQYKLNEIILIDCCFILTLFLAVAGKFNYNQIFDDPIFRMPWLLQSIRKDLLLLENQVPYLLLKTVLETSKITSELNKFVIGSSELNNMALKFFNYSMEQSEVWRKGYNFRAKHLLDLMRSACEPFHAWIGRVKFDEYGKFDECGNPLVSKRRDEVEEDGNPKFLKLIRSAKVLQRRGIKFVRGKDELTFIDIRRRRNKIEIPLLVLDDFMLSLLCNSVAFEQCYADSGNYITSYVVFMGCLLEKEADVMILSENGIIENHFGVGNEVGRFFQSICQYITFDMSKSYLREIFEGVNEVSSSEYRAQWADLKLTNFNTRWKCLSTCAALALLCFTGIQSFFAVYAYIKPPK